MRKPWGCADDYVVHAAVTRQQNLESRQQGGEQGGSGLAAEGF